MVTATFYSNNVFYGAVDVLRFWRCGIVPSGVGRGGVGLVGWGYFKACKVQQCKRMFATVQF